MALPRSSALLVTACLTFVLAGCSSTAADTTLTPGAGSLSVPSAEPASGSTLFEFQSNGVDPSRDVTIKFPADLLDALGAEADTILVKSIRLTPHPLDGLELCAVDVQFEFTDGAVGTILAPWALDKETARVYDQSLIDEETVSMEALTEAERMAAAFTWAPYARTGVDEPNPEPGLYLSDDLTGGVFVVDCAASAWSDEDSEALWIPQANVEKFASRHSSTRIQPTTLFAVVDVSVMVDGTIGVFGEVKGYERDANMNWIAN